MKTQRKDQTEEQYVMRAFALMVHMNRPYGSSIRKAAKDVWTLYPKGYANFERFYCSLKRLASNYGYSR